MADSTAPGRAGPYRHATASVPDPGRRQGHDVVVIGCGTVGTSVFLHLVDPAAYPHRTLHTGLPADRLRSVSLVDPNPVGWGLAFGDRDPLLMCNSAVDLNSLLAHHPEDFLDHLRQHGWQGRPDDCVPRSWMAAYCHQRYTRARQSATTLGIRVQHLRATAHAVAARRDGYRIHLDNGQEIPATHVVICPGVHQPRTPDGFAPYRHHPAYLDSPYPTIRLRRHLTRPARLLVLGTHQSAIDAALLLCRDGHHTTLTSPSGRLPAVRTALTSATRPHPPLQRITLLDPADPHLADKLTRHVIEAIRLIDPRPLRHQISAATDPVQRLREEIALAEGGACLWAEICTPLIEAVIALAAALPPAGHSALMTRFAWFISRYATATTLVNARRLLTHFTSGALRLADSYPTATAFTNDGWRIQWSSSAPEHFDHVVNATGFHPPHLTRDPDNDTWHLDPSSAPPGTVRVDSLEADLRLRSQPGAPPERIWVAGVATHIRIPFANHLRNAVGQAGHVADQIRSSPPA
ncbi:FAD/NAD(P)-binding protein [Streptomyces sp. NPDC003035]|uniref:FAD/NAD(P)-binding protein n=1 Tax=Streptomyces sp. NPDC003035 TaxID=3364676 RepID=UPI0036939102